MVVHADIVGQQLDIGFSQRRVSFSQSLVDQLAERRDRNFIDALRFAVELKRQTALVAFLCAAFRRC